ncbi:MAG: hypothetical protein U1E65_00430 [Myxococcota bacterium]
MLPLPFLSALIVAAELATFKAATKADRGPEACPKGSFLDPRLDDLSVGPQCYSCPKGFERTLAPVTSDEACRKPGGTDFDSADFKSHYGCDHDKREFYDPRKGGECWSCPKSKPRRTLYSVAGDKACATKEVFGEKLSSADFEHKYKDCTGGSFFDPRNGGECWKCPKGYSRTLEPVTSKKACEKDSADRLKGATLEGHFGCGKGQFLDVGTGTCWSCPSSHPYRTINPVSSKKACSSSLIGIFAAEGDTFCKQIIGDLKKADQGVEDLQQIVDRVLKPVRKPLEDKLDEMNDLMDQTKLDEMMGKTVRKLGGPALKRAEAFGVAVGAAKDKLKAIILDERLMCQGTPKQIDEAFQKLNLLGAVDTTFIAISAGGTFTDPENHITTQIALTWVTNLRGEGGLYVSAGLGATSSANPASFDVGAMLFPSSELGDFGLSAVPGMTVSVGKGPRFDSLFEKMPEIGTMVAAVDSIEVGWGFDPKVLPTLGVSKGLVGGEGGKALLEVSASVGWDFPVLTYRQWKLN